MSFNSAPLEGALILETARIREAELATGTVAPTLMERAGQAGAALAADLAHLGGDVLVLAGPGNNGGDSFEVARLLRQMFFRVSVVSPADPTRFPADAGRAYFRWMECGGSTTSEPPPYRRWALIVDGLFGIGLSRAPDERYARLIDYANRQRCPILALDLPSGLMSDTGQTLGATIRATHTLSFIAMKPGLLTLDGPDHCGKLFVANLDVDLGPFIPTSGRVASRELFLEALFPRPMNFHKGQAGSLAIIGGAAGMVGAALLAGRAALKLGAGRVYCGLLSEQAPVVDILAPELMLRPPAEALALPIDAVVAGPGLGRGEAAIALLSAALATDAPCVLDADALNLLAGSAALEGTCLRRQRATLLTPHPAEAGRLLDVSTARIQEDRLAAARALAERYSAHVLLKGNGSIIASPEGHWYINRSGNPGMASAGMGDSLAGMLGALLAQRIAPEAALVLATHLHGAAADELAAAGDGPVGITASETAAMARRVWNRWLAPRSGANVAS